jgi:dihydroorotate dehydrogenase electron transfer subunit
VSDCFFELTFAWDPKAGVPRPGQFCTVRVSPYTAPLLRRPFAFSSYNQDAGTASITYKKRGPATELLAGKASGDCLDVIGPLGNDFGVMASQDISLKYLVAGGTGFGPIRFLASSIAQSKQGCIVVLGCRTKSQLPTVTLPPLARTIVCTDDGSEGVKGTPLTYLETLAPDPGGSAAVFCCGPLPLLSVCHRWAQTRKYPCFVAMEQTMACGVGACMGCAVKVTDAASGYARACTEGPVFDSRRIAWT